MRKKTNTRHSIWLLQIIIGIFMILSVVFIKYYVEGQYYFSWELIMKWIREKRFCLDYLIFLEGALFAVLFAVRTILLIAISRAGILYDLATISLWLSAMAFIPVVQMKDPSPYMISCGVLLLLSLAEFMGIRFLEQREEIHASYEAAHEQEVKEKKHKKKADYFPGKYPKEFYRIIRNNFRYYWKEQMLVFLAATLICAVTQTVLAVFTMARALYSEDGALHFMVGEGLYTLFFNLGLILAVLSVFMMYMICSWYIREQQKEFRLLVVIGIRKRTAYLIFLVGYGCLILGGAVAGTLAGMALTAVTKNIFIREAAGGTELSGGITLGSTGAALLLFLLEMIFALGMNQGAFLALGRSTDLTDSVRGDRRPQTRLAAWILPGVVLFGLGWKWFSIREWAEMNMIYILPVSGMLLLILGLFAWFLKRRKGKEKYYETIFRWNSIYHRFWNSMGTFCFLAVVQFCILVIFTVQLTATLTKQDIASMYPYDYVYKAYEADVPELEEMIRENGVDARQYPMLVMTSIYGSDKLYAWGAARPIQWPQGQQIAISESTYTQLKKEKGETPSDLGLTGEEMHVVYQQDLSARTHTIDWDTLRMDKHLRFGQPLIYYNTADYLNVFPIREIRSEEKSSLIGSFCQGLQENLIVLSDEYFEENWQKITSYNRSHWEMRQQADLTEWRNYSYTHEGNMTEGPTVLFCLNVPEDRKAAVGDALTELSGRHKFDQTWDQQIQPLYEKTEMMRNKESEILFTRTAYAFIVLILMLISVFQYFTYVQKEEKNWKWEDTFLSRMGMRKKEREKKTEFLLKLYMFFPLGIGMACGVLYTALTLKARLFTSDELVQYIKTMAVVYAAYLCFYICIYEIEKIHIRRYIGESE